MNYGGLLPRRTFLHGIGALAGAACFSAPFGCDYLWAKLSGGNGEPGVTAGPGAEPLRQQAAAKGLIYGAATGVGHLRDDKDFSAHFAAECGILVPTNELKWEALRPSVESFDFGPADWLASFARSNRMLFRGHTLIWHISLPEWFHTEVNRDNAGQFMQEHITTVVKHYAGKIHSWDVVNEPISPSDGQPDGMAQSPWYQFLGPGYVQEAFRTAAAADPNAILVLNQDNLEYDSRGAEQYRSATLALLKKLVASGTPIHALGIQAHLAGGDRTFNAGKYGAFLSDVSALGLKILITELDVSDQNLPHDINIRDQFVARTYADFLTTVLREPSVIEVLTWGLSDKYTWLANTRQRADGAPVRPLPLDAANRRKLAWNAVAKAFQSAPARARNSNP